MLKGQINAEELEHGHFWVECIEPPKSGCCTKGKDYPCHIEHEAGYIYFVIPWNDNDERYLLHIGNKHVAIEGIFEVVR